MRSDFFTTPLNLHFTKIFGNDIRKDVETCRIQHPHQQKCDRDTRNIHSSSFHKTQRIGVTNVALDHRTRNGNHGKLLNCLNKIFKVLEIIEDFEFVPPPEAY